MEENNLKEEILQRINRRDNMLAIATTVVESIKKGDKSSINFMASLLEEQSKRRDEEKLPISNDKLREVICLAADRIRSKTV